MASTTVDPALPAAAVVADSGTGHALLQRVVAPRADDPLDVRVLYVDEDRRRDRARPVGRSGLDLPAGTQASFATYFNAFPAGYWRRWTTLESVRLSVLPDGPCRIDVYRSKADGSRVHVCGRAVPGAEPVTFDLDLAPFEDGGWYWFDVTTDDHPVTIADAGWYAPREAPGRAAVAIAITTYDRPDDCVRSLAAIAADPLVLAAVDAVIVTDQGARRVRDADGFHRAAERLGTRLILVEQGNLGGSGGFARGMHTALTRTACEQILLMDDDIVIEPDSILRAVAFSRFAERPMLVGGQMLDLHQRSRLHAMGEVVDPRAFTWRTAPHASPDHDFATAPLRSAESTDLHRRVDVDYNGWWMCLIPRSVAAGLGLPLPLFIKWDDAEYGLRAARAGYPTATLPGVAVWHTSWSDKDDTTDWQAYFHLRNRLVVAALHGTCPARVMLADSLRRSARHLLSLEYSTVALQERAIEDFRAGPDHLFDLLASALPQVRRERSEFADGRVLPSASRFPLPTMDAVRAERLQRPPATRSARAATMAGALAHNLLPARAQHHKRPQLNIPASDARWFLLSRIDGATVATSDGRGVAYRKRDPRTFWRLLGRSVTAHVRLAIAWPRLRRTYRAARGDLVSAEAWCAVFERQRSLGGLP